MTDTYAHDPSLINPDVMVFLRNFPGCFLLLVACFPYVQFPVHSTQDLRVSFLFPPWGLGTQSISLRLRRGTRRLLTTSEFEPTASQFWIQCCHLTAMPLLALIILYRHLIHNHTNHSHSSYYIIIHSHIIHNQTKLVSSFQWYYKHLIHNQISHTVLQSNNFIKQLLILLYLL